MEKKFSGLIISGTKTSPGFIENIGTLIAKMQIRKNGPKVKSPLSAFHNFWQV